MRNDVFICLTNRHIFYSLVMINEKVNKGDITPNLLLVCSNHQKLEASLFNKDKLKILYCKLLFVDERVLIDSFNQNSYFKKNNLFRKNISFSYKSGFQLAKQFISDFLADLFNILPTDNFYIFHDRTFIAKYIVTCKEVTLIEDGLANYTTTPVKGGIIKRLLRLFSGYNPMYQTLGENRNIKRIVLFSNSPVPGSISKKVEIVEYTKFQHEQSFIKTLFSFYKFDAHRSYNFVFLTQGIDVAGLCSTKEKLTLYHQLCLKLARLANNTILIKLHPSENFEEYKELFENDSDIDVINTKVPFEVFALAGGDSCRYFSLLTSSISCSIEPVNLIRDKKLWKNFESQIILEKASDELLTHF